MINCSEHNIEDIHEVSNSMTEWSAHYKRMSLNYLSCLNGLDSYDSKFCHIILSLIIHNKIYGVDGEVRTIDEEKRIYNNVSTDINNIALEFYCLDYVGKKDILESHRSIILKRVKKIDSWNIFYVWRLQDTYIFVMEREIGSWKVYNSNGYVLPRMLKKILAISEDMMLTMMSMIEKKGKTSKRYRINESFGEFINHIIYKMNPIVIKKLSIWDRSQDIHEYLQDLSRKLNEIDNNEGQAYAEDFIAKLPHSVSQRMEKKLGEKKKMKMKKTKSEQDQLIDDITPKNPILSKRTRTRGESVVKVQDHVSEPQKPESFRFDEEPEPFKNPREFVGYYRACITNFTGGHAKFGSYEVECPQAAIIMDLLLARGKQDKNFLTAWFRYYYDYKLKGNKAMKDKYTALKDVKETLDSFESIYISSL